MTELDPETFEEEKYVDHFPKLQQAYKTAFDRMNDRFDSTLVHAIDQQVLSESEPFYEGDGEFRIELPEDPGDRIEDVVVTDERLDEILTVYVEEIERELRRVFGVDA